MSTTATQINYVDELRREAITAIKDRENRSLNLKAAQKGEDRQQHYLTDDEGNTVGYCVIFEKKGTCRYKMEGAKEQEFQLANAKKQIKKIEVGSGSIDDIYHEDAMMTLRRMPKNPAHYRTKESAEDANKVTAEKFRIGQVLLCVEENAELTIKDEADLEAITNLDKSGQYTYQVLKNANTLKANQWVDFTGEGKEVLMATSTNREELESKMTETSKVYSYTEGLKMKNRLASGKPTIIREVPKKLDIKKPKPQKKVEVIPEISPEDKAILDQIREGWPQERKNRTVIVYNRVTGVAKKFKNKETKQIEVGYSFKSAFWMMNNGNRKMQLTRITSELEENEVILNEPDFFKKSDV